jgi:hypothetical protein
VAEPFATVAESPAVPAAEALTASETIAVAAETIVIAAGASVGEVSFAGAVAVHAVTLMVVVHVHAPVRVSGIGRVGWVVGGLGI